MCKIEGCKKNSLYNFEGNKPAFCFEHKEAEMVNVKCKQCEKEGCKKQPSYYIIICFVKYNIF